MSDHAGQPESAGFVARWSRRKHATRESDAEAQSPIDTPASHAVDPTPNPVADALPESGAAVAAPEAERPPLPDLDALGADSDYTGFLHPDVDKAVRKAALRKLFALPQFGVRDGLDDYDDDFTVFEPLGDTVTSDMRFHEARKRAEAEARAREAAAQADAESEGLRDDTEDPIESNDSVDEAVAEPAEGAARSGDPARFDDTDDAERETL
ncbi:MAG: DUF3306 domain-containing protein [Pseudomonadota bacterium]